jgi:hypothetical protein
VREREPFWAVTRAEIDAVWGWNGNSAAKVVRFRYTAAADLSTHDERQEAELFHPLLQSILKRL